MLGEILSADRGHRGRRVPCGRGHEAVFVSYRDKVIDTVLGPVALTGPGTTARPAGMASRRATPSSGSQGRACRRAWPR
jgi:hypothetical protein